MTALAIKISVSSVIVNPRISLLVNQPLQSLLGGLFCFFKIFYMSLLSRKLMFLTHSLFWIQIIENIHTPMHTFQIQMIHGIQS